MKGFLCFLLLLTGFSGGGIAQTNVQLLHQLVEQSKSENTRQNEARNRQGVTSANEEVNRGGMSKLKAKYRELQSRFAALGLAIDAVQIGIQGSPIVNEIIAQQQLIFERSVEDPLLIALAYDVEADLAGQAHLLLNYLYGLAISMGDLNQMKPSDRKILFSHVLVELRRIAGASRGLAQSLWYAGQKRSLERLNPFSGFIQQDKQMVDGIMRKVEILKQP